LAKDKGFGQYFGRSYMIRLIKVF